MARSRLALGFELAARTWRSWPRLGLQSLRMATLLDYRLFASGWAFPPVSISLELTARCNLTCPMCWLWGDNRIRIAPSYVGNDLDTEAVKRTIDEVARFRPFIYLQGGEILLRKDAAEIMRHLARRHLVFGFTTNGTVMNPELAREIARHATVVSVSIDGMEATHDAIRGKGNFQRALAGIRQLVEARGASAAPLIKMNTLSTGLTLPEMEQLLDLAGDLGVDVVKFGNLQFLTRERADQHKQEMKELFGIDCTGIDSYVSDPQLDVAELWAKLSSIRSRRRDGVAVQTWTTRSLDGLKRWYAGTVKDNYRFCFFPWFSVMIRGDGSVVPCGEYRQPEYSAGNVREQSFSEIWNGPKMRRFRQALKQRKFFAGCDRCCGLDSFAR